MKPVFRARGWRGDRPDNPAGWILTPSQYAVAELMGKGHSCSEVGAILGLTPGSVKVCLSRDIYPKLDIASQPALIRWWMENVEKRGNCETCMLRQAHLITISS